MAAVLAGGTGAALSHHSAAAMWKISRRNRLTIDVVLPRNHADLTGVRFHRVRNIHPADVTICNRIPITTVSRTLIDLADTTDAFDLANLMYEAAYRRLLDIGVLRACIERNRNRHGHSAISRALELHQTGSAGVRSRPELRFLRLMAETSAGEPHVNASIAVAGHVIELDFYWRRHRLCVEIDGPGHERKRAQREDALRDALLRSTGIRVVRIPTTLLEVDPERAVRSVVDALGV